VIITHFKQDGKMKQKNKLSNLFFLIPIIIALAFTNKIEDPMSNLYSPQHGDYISPVVYGLEKKDTLLKMIPSSMFYQIMAANFSYVSDYPNTLKFWDMQRDTNKVVLSDDAFKSINEKIELQNAAEYILNRAATEKIIMFNEAHHIEQNRAFIATLLKGLKKEGFNYLALETLNYMDVDSINKRKYVLQYSGTYTADPVFASMLNYALKLGYTLVAYENRNHCMDTSPKCMEEREINQAKNLAQVYDNDKNAKIIVLGGYDHILEENSNIKMMAHYFKEQTQINPLTIDQVELCEKSNPSYEHPFYTKITKDKKITSQVVPLIQGNPYLTLSKNSVDIQIISPRVTLINKRPDYLLNFADKQKFILNKKKIPAINSSFVLIQAFNLLPGENNKEVIPSDQFLLSKNEYDAVAELNLYLEKGNYLIKVLTNTNSTIYNEKISVH